MKKIHKEIRRGWTNCGIHVAIQGHLTSDDAKVTCTNCIRHSAAFIKAHHLDYMLKTFIDFFESAAEEGDTETFRTKHPGLKWKAGFKEAIISFSDRKSSKELMIAYLIDAINEIEKREGVN